MSHNKSVLATIITTVLIGASSAHAAQVPYATFTSAGAVSNLTILTPDGSGATADNPNYDPYYDPYGPPSSNSDPYIRGGNGYVFGHTNNVTFTWDGTIFNSSADYTGVGSVSNATISVPTPLLGVSLVIHDVQIFGTGTYIFDSTLANGGANTETGNLSMTVGANQLGVHMLMDFNGNNSIDIVNVWNLNSTFSACGTTYTDPYASNCLWTGSTNPGGTTASTVFMLASTDNDGDGTLGIPMATGGPFGGGPNYSAGFNFNFNMQGTLTTVPVPGAAWLLGSGLLGLMGLARRKA